MQVRILYFNGCPNWQTAAERLRIVLAEVGRADVAVESEDVHKTSHLSLAWAGSPTVLLDGRDPFAAVDGPLAARDACRIYVTEAGLEPAPSLDQLRTALTQALKARRNINRS
jgi:hypothetical protein